MVHSIPQKHRAPTGKNGVAPEDLLPAPADWPAFRASLAARPRVVPPWDRFPPLPPEDPLWPTPESWSDVHALAQRLPVKQQAICAVIAAEMVVRIWEEEANAREWAGLLALPAEAIALVRRWTRGEKATTQELAEAVDGAGTASARAARVGHDEAVAIIEGRAADDDAAIDTARATEAARQAASVAGSAAIIAYQAVYRGEPGPEKLADAVRAGAAAGQESRWWPSRLAFFRDWWGRCRAKLAFRDVTTAEVSGPAGFPPVPEDYDLMSPPAAAAVNRAERAKETTGARPSERGSWIRLSDRELPWILQGLAAEARKVPDYAAFRRAYLLQLKHGLYWHLTRDSDFYIDPAKGPRDMSSMSAGEMTPGTLMITSDLGCWADHYGEARPFAAVVDMRNVPPDQYWLVQRGFGNEFYVADPSRASVRRVFSVAGAEAFDEQQHPYLPDSDEELQAFYNAHT